LEPAYGSTYAVLDLDTLKLEQDNALFLNNQVELREKLFMDLCPSYTSDPCAAAQAIRQTTIDKSGQVIVNPVSTYVYQFKLALRPIFNQDPAPMNYSQQLVSHLEPDLKKKLESQFKEHITCTDMSRRGQMNLLTRTCLAIHKQDDELNVFQRLINKKTIEQNTYMNKVLGAAIKVDLTDKSHDEVIAVMASVAEHTLTKNSLSVPPGEKDC